MKLNLNAATLILVYLNALVSSSLILAPDEVEILRSLDKRQACPPDIPIHRPEPPNKPGRRGRLAARVREPPGLLEYFCAK